METFTIEEKNLLTAQIGNLMQKVDSIQNLKTTGAQNGNFLETVAAVDVLLNDLNQEIGRLPPLEFFENLELECPLDVFFETFAIILKNATLSFQSNFFKTKKYKRIQFGQKYQF